MELSFTGLREEMARKRMHAELESEEANIYHPIAVNRKTNRDISLPHRVVNKQICVRQQNII